MKKKKVLFLEWASHGRDFEIILPLIFFFEEYLKWDVITCSIFNPYEIIRQKPDLIIMSNITGAIENFKVSKFIKKNTNIPLIAHVSEGFFRENELDEFIFGWGKQDAVIYSDLTLLWSYHAYNLVKQKYPEIIHSFEVSGSLGHDKYKNISHRNIAKDNYKKIIGYAGFDFNNVIKKSDDKSREYYKNKAKEINKTLDYVINKNEDILFLLKPHPGDSGFDSLEFLDLKKYKNVLIASNHENIADLINSSDIWLCYNSGTTLEAWLLNKTTIVINNSSKIFGFEGFDYNLVANDKYQLNSLINEYYNFGCISNFYIREFDRKCLINKLIGFDDGLNHVRFIKYIKNHLLSYSDLKYKLFSKDNLYIYMVSFRYKLSIYLNNIFGIKTKRFNLYALFSIKGVMLAKKNFYPDYRLFHTKNAIKVKKILSE